MVSREYVYNSKRNNRNKRKTKNIPPLRKEKKQKPLGKIDDNFVLKIYYGLYRKKQQKEKTKMINYVKDSEAICSNLVNSNTFENKMRIFNKRLERQNKIKKTKQKQMKMKL